MPGQLKSGKVTSKQHHHENLSATNSLKVTSFFLERRSTWDWRSGASDKRSAPTSVLPRKEVIQPHLPVRLPCYDFTPITDPTLDACLPHAVGVSPAASGVADFRGVTGGVYKTRERIHRGVLTHGY